MTVESEISRKASLIYEFFHPGEEVSQFDDADQYIISLAKGNSELSLRVAKSKDAGSITGVDHRGDVVVTVVAPNSTRVFYINGERASVWLEKLKGITDGVFKDAGNFTVDEA